MTIQTMMQNIFALATLSAFVLGAKYLKSYLKAILR